MQFYRPRNVYQRYTQATELNQPCQDRMVVRDFGTKDFFQAESQRAEFRFHFPYSPSAKPLCSDWPAYRGSFLNISKPGITVIAESHALSRWAKILAS